MTELVRIPIQDGEYIIAEVDMDSSSMTGWEESGRPHPARTALNLSQPS
jgi:hypothetical protein